MENGKIVCDSRINCRIATKRSDLTQVNPAVFGAALQMPLNRDVHVAQQGIKA